MICGRDWLASRNKLLKKTSTSSFNVSLITNFRSSMDHITAIETIAAQLSDIGSERTEAEIITKIICTLPPSFRSVRSAWENVDDSKKTLQLLTTRLLKEESYNQEFEGVHSDAAFFAKQTEPGFKMKNNVSCGYCGRKRLVEEDCWKKAQDERESQAKFAHSYGKSEPSYHSSQHKPSWSGDYAFQCSISNHPSPKDDNWLVDSGASQHMSDQSWAFVNYQRVKLGSWPVNGIGNNRKPLQVHGYGTISISSLVEGRSSMMESSKRFFTFLSWVRTSLASVQQPVMALELILLETKLKW